VPRPEPRDRGLRHYLRPSALAAPPLSRRTCAATRTVARMTSGDFPRGLRVFRFGSALWAPRVLGRFARGCDRGSWEGRSGAFLKLSVVGLSPPPSGQGCAVSAPAHAPSGRSRLSMYCSRSSRSSCIVPPPPYQFAPPGTLYALLSLSRSGSGLCPLQFLRPDADIVHSLSVGDVGCLDALRTDGAGVYLRGVPAH
jgi:hypothetical protein